jgi:nitroimidazol reductase NimA-like FMN-containing flavoprotein (pyridoxamine 5'-phosphate oxidase superfamily)
MPESIELSREEAEALLRQGVFGRVAVTTPSGPHIVPVNYSVVDDAVVMRTLPYSLLATHGRGAVVAFEVDHVDHEHQRGWSVVARGTAEMVDDPDLLAHIEATLPPRPWAAGNRNLVLRLVWDELTGRKLGTGWTAGLGLGRLA